MPRFRDAGLPAQWLALLLLSVPFVEVLRLLDIPAALLVGPMMAAIAVSALEGRVRIAAPVFAFAQGVVGCLIASGIPPSMVGELGKNWGVFVFGVFMVIAIAAVLGYFLARGHVLPGTTAVWGSAPGAATAMVLMAESGGADMRLVAFMQYLRVLCVALAASIVARVWASASGDPAPVETPLFAPVPWQALVITLAIAAAGTFAGQRFRIPAGPLVCTLFLAIVIQDVFHYDIVLPGWLLAFAYAFVGWGIGVRFTREIVIYAAKVFPRIIASTLALMAICAGLAAVLVHAARLDPLTAYLATSPGGADSVAIIAASSRVDVPFVMTMQVLRFFTVMLIGPALTRFIAARAK